ncbi:MAG TPA: flagellar motor protein [Candidatus Saccharimonadales bacterium]|nr:flagellar motor protein [Candidatus Saccharimonadales bacterium]
MDFATLGGLILAVGAILISYLMEGGKIGAVLQAPAMILVLLGTIGAGTITTSMRTLRNIPTFIRIALFEGARSPVELINTIVMLAEKARRDGLLPLESEAKKIKDPFLKKAVELVVDGTDPAVVRSILETEMAFIAQRHKEGATLFQKLGGFAPTLGIIGTVLGLVHTLGNISDASKMAESIAGAFIATLWGISSANLFYLPIGDKLKLRHEEEQLFLELAMEGVISIQSGENPRVIRTKLLSFLEPKARTEPQKKAA